MTRIHRIARKLGFTLVELIVAIAVLGTLLAIGAPLILKTLHTAKMTSAAFDCNSLLRRAKSQAIKKNSPAVVRYDPLTESNPADSDVKDGRLVAFIDVHGLDPDNDPPDSVFNPVDDGRPFTETDHEIWGCYLPPDVTWGGPEEDPDMLVGFTTVGKENVAIIDPDGSVRDIGAFRFGDTRDNHLAIQMAPAATARITLLKWDREDDTWKEQEEEGKKWTWY